MDIIGCWNKSDPKFLFSCFYKGEVDIKVRVWNKSVIWIFWRNESLSKSSSKVSENLG